MLAQERQREILNRVLAGGSVRVAQLARELNVTEETIRRDLERLDQEGRLIRIHGGALPPEKDRRDLPFVVRETVNLNAKRSIALCAVRHVADGDVIALDASSTAREMARLIPDIPLTVITNSIAVVAELVDRIRVRVISTGGVLDAPSLSYIGPLAEQALSRFHIRKLFLSCQGVDFERGLSVTADEHAGIKHRMMELAETTILLVDQSKFGVRAVEFFGPLADIDMVITDAGINLETKEKLEAHGLAVEVAD